MDKIIYNAVYNRKGLLSKEGTAPVSICLYLNKKRKYITTEIRITPEQWDKRKQRIKANAPNYIQKNRYITELITNLERFELDQRDKGFSVTLNSIIEEANPKENKTDFLTFFKNQIRTNNTITESTKTIYTTTYKHIKEFKDSILFDDLTFKFVHEFECFLLNKGLNINTTGKYLKTLKAVINMSINYGLFEINKYPFRNFKIKTQASSRTYLSPQEIQKIENLKIPKDKISMAKVRDMYLFAIYSGLRFSDIVRLTPKNIQVIDGNKYIVLKMEKTKEPLRLPIYLLFDGKPIDLIDRYTDENKKYFFDDYTNQFVNRELKEIAREANINKVVTFHTARHTTATYLLYKGVSMSVVQKILGHTKMATTQIYAKVMNMTVENELKKTEWK